MVSVTAPLEVSGTALLRQLPLGEQLSSAIRRDIITGRLQPDTVLPQEKLCSLYQVSRIPVRDALILLSAQGFVVRNRRNQMVVAKITTDDLVDTIRVEAQLCGMAARRAANRATDEEVAALVALVKEPSTTPERRAKLSWEFHRQVNAMARSPRLLAALRAVSVPFAQDFREDLRQWWETSADEHLELALAIEARDVDKAQELMVDHFEHIAQAVARVVEAEGSAAAAQQLQPV
jgi:DNA-binding GntR family transcriptional regulator